MAMFAVEFVYSDETREERLAVRAVHREYNRALADQGILVVAGPWADDSGAQLIYQVADEAELRKILDEDPYTPAGVIADMRIREWNVLNGSWYFAAQAAS